MNGRHVDALTAAIQLRLGCRADLEDVFAQSDGVGWKASERLLGVARRNQ